MTGQNEPVRFVDGICGGERALLPGTSILVCVLVQRWCSGESITSIAIDYNVPHGPVERAIQCYVRALRGRRGMKVERALKQEWQANK